MKIAFLGDSITAGCGASAEEKMFVNVVGKKLKAEVFNYGVSGSRIASREELSDNEASDCDFVSRSKKISLNVDLVFVFGGTNDYGHGRAPLGSMDDESPYTFFGAVKSLVVYLIGIYGKDRVVFILPTRRFDDDKPTRQDGEALSVYASIINYVCNIYGVKVLDLFSKGIPKPDTEEGDGFTVDGLHPNDRGHEFIAESICRFIEERL